jgi:hypothetical protein
MRVLLDESVPRQLAAHLPGHEVQTVQRQGWSGLKNGQLLRQASSSFDVFITGDQGIEHQQNLSELSIRLVVVAGKNNRVETFVALAPRIAEAIDAATPGRVVHVAG